MKPAPEPAQSVQVKAAEFFTPFQLSTKDLDSILLTTDVRRLPWKRNPKRVPVAKIHRVVPVAKRVQIAAPQVVQTPKVILHLKLPLNPGRKTAYHTHLSAGS